MPPHPLLRPSLALVARPWLAACTRRQRTRPGSEATAALTVESSADACELTTDEAPSGTVAFKVKNTGDEVTEFYLYGEDGLRIVGEIENVGPALSVTSSSRRRPASTSPPASPA